ncbi:uncharacterized protein LOC117638386 [Prunus dulcis]|uniref:uncharacterized protein LOC117638386 n=1 Tax=Prunus dulcis TaxID=3755 RepID=UPI001482DE25|nr:uncharacterized protein LOC117638386 [Prunus dulcis]
MEGVEVGTDDSFKRLVLQKKVKQLGTFESNKKQKKKLNTYIRLIGSVFKTNDPLYYTDVVVVEAAKLVTKYTRYTGDKNNELLLKNHQSRPTGSAPLPEINAASQEVNATSSRGNIHKRGRWGKRGHWQGNRKNRGARSEGLGPRSGPSTNGKNASRNKGKSQMSHVPRNVESPCHRCGAKGHWVRACRTPRHLGDLYQASLKNRKVEINYIDHAPPATNGSSEISRQLNKTHLDVSDFVTKRGNEAYESELE